jgi:hypothetical protein
MRLLHILCLCLSLASCTPKTTYLDPDKGSIEGGDSISIHGPAFGDGLRIMFGNKPVDRFKTISTTELEVTVPTGDTPGPVDVTLIDSHGRRTEIPKGYTYLPRKDAPTGTAGAR